MKTTELSDTKFCRFLKAKNSFGTMEGGDNPWFAHDDANSIYWCIKSTGAGGLDNGPVDPRLCVKGRGCYKERD